MAEIPLEAVAVQGAVGHCGAAPGVGLFWRMSKLDLAGNGQVWGRMWPARLLTLADAQ